jgi:hypothetical protein
MNIFLQLLKKLLLWICSKHLHISKEITANIMDAVSTKIEETFETLTAKKGDKKEKG